MRGRATLTAGVVDPVLTPSTLGLLALGTGLDLLSRGQPGTLSLLAFWAIAGGVAGGTWCATFALLDWVFAPPAAERGYAGAWALHGFATATIVGLYAVDALFRLHAQGHAPAPPAAAVEVGGAALLVMKIWIGRELRAGVEP
jgi:hypothetical protein